MADLDMEPMYEAATVTLYRMAGSAATSVRAIDAIHAVVDAARPLIEAAMRDRIAANLEQAAFLSTLVTDGHVGKALRAEIDSRSKAYESAAKIARGTA